MFWHKQKSGSIREMEEIEFLLNGMNKEKRNKILNLIWSFAGLDTENDPNFNFPIHRKKCWHS